jgi:hypothetical protein
MPTRPTPPQRRRRGLTLFATTALLALGAATAQLAWSQPGNGAALQDCETRQDRATCERELRNARAEQRRGTLEVPGADYRANALARCAPFTGDDRTACESRIMGAGNVSGSVAGGGLLREAAIVVKPDQGSAGAAPSAPASPVPDTPPPTPAVQGR